MSSISVSKNRTFVRRVAGWSAATVLGCAAAIGGAYLFIESHGNLHAVEPHVLYRSAQLDKQQLTDAIQSLGIKTVLNLRGPNQGKDWYDDEVVAVQSAQVKHIDFALSAQHDLSLAQMNELMRIIDKSPKPVLVHCNGGSDRTGLVSALYELSHGRNVEIASQQLALRYGHFPYLGSATIAMDRSLALYVANTASKGASSPQDRGTSP